MKLIPIFIMMVVFLFAIPFEGRAEVKRKNSDQSRGLSTQLDFEDLLIQGTYHFSDEAVATVEEDKVLDSLLVIRKDFKDRIERSAGRN